LVEGVQEDDTLATETASEEDENGTGGERCARSRGSDSLADLCWILAICCVYVFSHFPVSPNGLRAILIADSSRTLSRSQLRPSLSFSNPFLLDVTGTNLSCDGLIFGGIKLAGLLRVVRNLSG